MSIIIESPPAAPPQATASMLVSPDAPIGYSFAPSSDADDATVTIVRTDKRQRDTYVLTVDEARRLWRFLRAKGFEVF